VFRYLALAVFVSAIAISGARRRRAHRAVGSIPRSKEPGRLIAGRLLVALPLFGGVLAYLVNPAWVAWASFGLPDWARYIGAAIGVTVVPAVNWILAALGTNVSETVLTREQHRLVTTGPYRILRHPLYSAGIALFVGMGLMAANWFILLWAAVAAAGVRLFIIPAEERELLSKFGDDYVRYRRRTGALVPSLRRSAPRGSR
jgi:protein-S-isoprenylcysteine O-methyltransferase Ste14